MRADFYHLTRMPLEKILPSIAERVLGQGERLVVVADDEKMLARLDTLLWSYKPESFLPHGRNGDQPVLLTREAVDMVYTQNIAIVDGTWRDAALAFNRAFYVFDTDMIAAARAAWRGLTDKADVERHYWKQDEAGKWVEGP